MNEQYQYVFFQNLDIVRSFALEAENGNMISLPFKVKALKEYDYIIVGFIKKKENAGEYPFQSGKLKIDGYGIIRSTSSKVLTEPKLHQHIIDAEKLPTNAAWRFRQEGDTFAPLGLGGSKKLKEYFIDKKIPQRMRNEIPVLAVGNKILAVADIEIADELKVTNETKTLTVDGLFVCIGRGPDTEMVDGDLTLNAQGYIVTDDCMRTNYEGVYAIGDIRQTPLRQIVTACSDGAIAATKAFEYIKTNKAKFEK